MMKMKSAALGALLIQQAAMAAQTVGVAVDEHGKILRGVLYVPQQANEQSKPLPLVLVVHEWWGKSEHAENRAKRIADELGYAALAVDLYGDSKVTTDAKEAHALASPFFEDPSIGINRMKTFIAVAPAAAKKVNAKIDRSKIGAIGFCFGGTQVLNLARSNSMPEGEKLLGVVSFHGGLSSTLHAHAPLQTQILVLHGENDQMVKPEDVAAFKEEMKKAHANMTFKSYPGAMHGFTNPKADEMGKKNKIPVAYNAQADAQSWRDMADFFKKVFGQ